MSSSVVMPVTIAENIFHQLIWQPAIKSLCTAYPFLSMWPCSAFVNTISNYIFSGITQVVDIGAIQLLNDAHQNAYVKSSVTLKVIAHDKGIDSKEFNDARDQALIALSAFTRVNK